jgi:hypothetical protein
MAVEQLLVGVSKFDRQFGLIFELREVITGESVAQSVRWPFLQGGRRSVSFQEFTKVERTNAAGVTDIGLEPRGQVSPERFLVALRASSTGNTQNHVLVTASARA